MNDLLKILLGTAIAMAISMALGFVLFEMEPYRPQDPASSGSSK
ncbi:hypothetical protein [Parafrankia sp. FMc2]